MPDLLLELLSEEIPARMQEKACADLQRLFAEEIGKSGLTASGYTAYATPRRLALIARDLPLATQSVSEEIKGPRTSAPEQALEGFLRKTALQKENLVERGGVWFAVIDKPGRAAADVLGEAIPAIVRAFPWPKSMRWGAASRETTSLRWVRPLQGIVALLGDDVVPFEVAGIRAGAATVGHRFHHPGPITIGSAADYADKLRMCHVIVDAQERQAIIRTRAAALAAEAGLSVVPDEGLVAENAGLTEWPVPLLGAFDPGFLEVPPEVITLTMRTNQKYFACTYPPRHGEGDHAEHGGGGPGTSGALAPYFICTANIDPVDGGAAIAAGNARVLAARLSDAKFFWEQDLKVPLEEQAKKLDRIVFHEKLGTVADKVERVAKLARWLVEEGIVGGPPSPLRGEGRGEGERAAGARGTSMAQSPLTQPSPPRGEGSDRAHLATLAEQAARLCKADLVTGMVGEFPELQGVIGGYYARAQGLDPQVADAIRDHYKPVGQGDEVPTAPVTVAVSLADKLDTLAGFFGIGELPTGSKDPFALRRAALAVIAMFVSTDVRASLGQLFTRAIASVFLQLVHNPIADLAHSFAQLADFLDGGDLVEEVASAIFERGADVINARFGDTAARKVIALRELRFFFADRLKVQQREAGVRHDLIDAVFALGGEDDLVRLLARVKALQAFVGTEDGANLLVGYRRAANILRKENYTVAPTQAGAAGGSSDASVQTIAALASAGATQSPLSYTPEKEEAALVAALDAAEPRAETAVQAEDFEGAMTALATLRVPIDAFFDKVTVNDTDPQKRFARLALLARVRDAVHRVADFSKIEG